MFFKNNKYSNKQNRGAYDVIFLMALVILLLVFSAIAANIDFSSNKDSKNGKEETSLSTTVEKVDTTEKSGKETSSDKDTTTPPQH